ncbi:Chloroperoxidase [Lentinula edodes]|uniref:Chloroperoxidase n=1 Tax=Lentinula edodes TaxID=5353 RepID=UPI001E8CBF3D|nr:Chloroperoxidase [Lentinula edodes]KAH7868642.1 Chloroperoxidase [Lentinula edodes]KAJ3903422.1 Chloroperoxidase [Lentinula edodes]
MAHKILEARTTNDTSLADAYAIAHPPTDKRTTVNFDPTLQYVSTTGQHAFIPPGPGDFRGPCPGLNAMANHGYIPRNGIATIDQFVDGTYTVFGMGRDLALILATYGTVFDGDMSSLSFSIGEGDNSILGSLFPQNGLTGSHNNYEADVSPMKGDLFQYKNNYDVQMSQFRQLYDLQSNVSDPSQVNYDIPLLTSFRVSRFQQSIANNPYFVNGVFSGIAVQPAAYQFIYRFMANKSEEYPEGRLDREVLKSFYAISGSEDQFVYTSGYERIPNNWYKRAIGDEYGMVPFAIELGLIALAHPEFLSIGGNTGQVDTFTGVNLADLTGGVYDASTLLEGNNLGCFVLQAAVMNLPTSVAGLLEGVLNDLAGIVNPLLQGWDCPELENIDESLLEKFPGYSRSSGDVGV